MKLWPFRVLECIYVYVFAIALCTFWYRPVVGTEAIPFYFTVVSAISIGVLLHLWRLSNKPEPPVALTFPWGKVLKGNAVALACLVFMVVLYGPNPEYILFVIAGVFIIGNSMSVVEWRWRKFQFLRLGNQQENKIELC